jgi:hypothetical protein
VTPLPWYAAPGQVSRRTVTDKSHTVQVLVTLGAPTIVFHLTPRDAQVVGMNGAVLWNLLSSCFRVGRYYNAVRWSAKPLYALYVLVNGQGRLFPGSRLARCAASVVDFGDQACMTPWM